MKEQYVIIECVLETQSISVWGPFKSKIDATDWCHRRIAMLAKESCGTDEETLVTDAISWQVQRVNLTQ